MPEKVIVIVDIDHEIYGIWLIRPDETAEQTYLRATSGEEMPEEWLVYEEQELQK